MSKNKQQLDSAVEEGRRAFRDNPMVFWNPYLKRHSFYCRFNRGWHTSFFQKVEEDEAYAFAVLSNVSYMPGKIDPALCKEHFGLSNRQTERLAEIIQEHVKRGKDLRGTRDGKVIAVSFGSNNNKPKVKAMILPDFHG